MPESVRVTRLGPLLGPGAAPGYAAVFNAGVVRLGDEFHLFARGVREGYRPNPGPGPRFLDYRSDILWFSSTDGVDYRFRRAVLRAEPPVSAYEDPRLQWVGRPASRLVMTYTHVEEGRPWRIGICELEYRDDGFEVVEESRRVLGHPAIADKDGVLFHLSDGRLALYHRVYPNVQLAVFEGLDDLVSREGDFWEDHYRRHLERRTVLRAAPGAHQVGAGPAPLRVDGHLLFFFHQRGGDQVYRNHVGLVDPTTGRITAFTRHPILEPETDWEKRGDVDNVVYVQGAELYDPETVYLTYGAADRHVGAALVPLEPLIESLHGAPPPGPSGEW